MPRCDHSRIHCIELQEVQERSSATIAIDGKGVTHVRLSDMEILGMKVTDRIYRCADCGENLNAAYEKLRVEYE
jgi:hypothetical protein